MRKIKASFWMKCWIIVAIVSGICFLYLFIGYGYEQISWNVFRYSFVRDGYVVKVDKQLAVGIEQIIRGENTLKIIRQSIPDFSQPEEGKEYLLLHLKIKNVSRKVAKPWSLTSFLESNEKDVYGHSVDFIKVDLPPMGKYGKLGEFTNLVPGEIREHTSGFMINKNFSLREMDILIEKGKVYDSFRVLFNKSPWQSNNNMMFGFFWNYITSIFLVLNFRGTQKKRSYFRIRYWIFPILLTVSMLLLSKLSSKTDFETIPLILISALISWWAIVLIATASTVPKREEPVITTA